MKKILEFPLIPLFKEFTRSSEKGKRRTSSGKKISAGTIELYKFVQKLLVEYEQLFQTTIRFRPHYKNSVVHFKTEKKYWDKFFRNFFDYLYRDKKYYDQFAGTVFKTIRTFLNYVIVQKGLPIGQFYKNFRIPNDTPRPVVLSPTQLKVLITDEPFRSQLPRHLQRTLDIFIFGCTAGLRWSDLMRLKKKNLLNTPDGVLLEIHTQKTGTAVRIPIPDYLSSIITKYKTKNGIYLLPRLASSNMNLQVKEIIKLRGWSYPMPKYRHRQGKVVEIKNKEGNTFSFCDHITAHTMRRTAITTLLILGVPELMVRKISGHAQGSTEFYRYVSVAQEYLNQEVKNAYKKLVEPTSFIPIKATA